MSAVLVGPDVVESDVVESGIVESDVVESDVVEPDVVESDVVEPGIVESDVVESDVVEPDVVETDVVETDVVELDVDVDSVALVAASGPASWKQPGELMSTGTRRVLAIIAEPRSCRCGGYARTGGRIPRCSSSTVSVKSLALSWNS